MTHPLVYTRQRLKVGINNLFKIISIKYNNSIINITMITNIIWFVRIPISIIKYSSIKPIPYFRIIYCPPSTKPNLASGMILKPVFHKIILCEGIDRGQMPIPFDSLSFMMILGQLLLNNQLLLSVIVLQKLFKFFLKIFNISFEFGIYSFHNLNFSFEFDIYSLNILSFSFDFDIYSFKILNFPFEFDIYSFKISVLTLYSNYT